MQDSEKLLGYVQQGIDTLLKQKSFDGGQEFRRTQKQALEAYKRYLSNDNYTTAEKLKGFFEIPTGVGKTAVFVGIVSAAHKAAQENGEELKTVIVVPTTQLLGQTVEAIEKFAPQLKNIIGLYGDGKKNLKEPLTIMTYDAFVELTEAGIISSDNVDVLISDEAHRGTSERRVESLSTSFNETTVQLALTATAHFDDTKSVENSHEREIFYKSVADAIKEGELAAYASSQRYVIRVDPDEYMLSDKFTKASDDRKIAYRRAAKQNAWNKRMVKIFSDGRDEKTGDLLSDNQAGFFVEGTKQADKLELLLNDDLTLVKRAEDMGYEGVAVAIHSKLSKKEQNRRYQAYKEGKYLAVVGDEMFKEGFDHPPMKTIFDCPHSSVVDKAQILGRGLRKWYNDLKDRFEGLTVIDTVMYFGDENSDVEAKNKERALLNTVSVKQVLESFSIESDDYFKNFKKSSKSKVKANKSKTLFADDPDVEEYTTLEGLYELEQQIADIELSYASKDPLTMTDIKATINAYREDNDNQRPYTHGGLIVHEPLANGNTTWNGLSINIRNGYGGLTEDPEYKAWTKTENKPSLFKLINYFLGKKPLTMTDIEETIKAYRAANDSQNPSKNSGDIIHEPLADMDRTWRGLDEIISYGSHKLKEDPRYKEWTKVEKKPSLSKLLVHMNYASERKALTMVDIKATVDAYRNANSGKNPSKNSGDIIHEPLGDRDMTWDALDQAIKRGRFSLSDDPDYQEFLKQNKGSDPTLYTFLLYWKYTEPKSSITMKDIKLTIQNYRDQNNGKNPAERSGDIAQKPLADRKMKWSGLVGNLRKGSAGLKDDPEYQAWIRHEDKPNIVNLCKLMDGEKRDNKPQPPNTFKGGPS